MLYIMKILLAIPILYAHTLYPYFIPILHTLSYTYTLYLYSIPLAMLILHTYTLYT